MGPGPVQPSGFRQSRRRELGQASEHPSPAPLSVPSPFVPVGWPYSVSSTARTQQETRTSGMPSAPAAGERGGHFEADHSLWPKILWTQVTCLSCLSKYPVRLTVTEYLLLPGPIPGPPAYLICVVRPTTTWSIVIPFCCRNRGSEM